MKLIKKQDRHSETSSVTEGTALGSAIDRRTFLRRSGIAIGGPEYEAVS